MKRLSLILTVVVSFLGLMCLTGQSAWSIENGKYAWVSRDFHASSVRSLSMSADGNLFVFSSVEAFPEMNDTNGTIDVYLWDRSTNTLVGVSRTGVDMTGGYEPIISPNGQYVLYHDLNGVIMIYTVSTDAVAVLTDVIGQTYTSSINSVSANGKYLIVENDSQESILFNIQDRTHVPVTDPVDGLLPNWGSLRSASFHGNYIYYAYNSGYAAYDIVADDVQILAGTTDRPWYGEIATVSSNGEGVLFQTGNTGAPCSGYYLWKLSPESYQCVDSDFSEGNTLDNIYFDLSGGTNRYLLATGTKGGSADQHSTLYDLETDTKTVVGAGFTIWAHSPFAGDTNAFWFRTTDQIDPDDSSGSLDYYLYEFDDSLIQTETPTVTPTATSTPTDAPTPTPTPTPEGFDVTEDAWSFENAGYDITWDHFRAAFGDDQTMTNGKPSEDAQAVFNDGRYGSSGKGGLCFGFNLTGAKIYADLPSGFSLPSSYASYSDVHSVPGPFRLFGLFQNGEVPDYLAQYFLYQFGKEYTEQVIQNYDARMYEVVQQIMASVDGDLEDPLMLHMNAVRATSIPLLNQCVGHVIMPFKYQETKSGWDVWVYDSNHPDTEMLLQIESDGNWSYDQWNSTQTCYTSLFTLDQEKLHISPSLIPIASQTFAGRIPTLQTSASGPQVSSIELNNASMIPQAGMHIFMPAVEATDVVSDVHTTLIVSGTNSFTGTVYYTNTTDASIGFFSGTSVLIVEAKNPSFGMSDEISMDSDNALIKLNSASTLTKTIKAIVDQESGQRVDATTCSFSEGSFFSQEATDDKTVLRASKKFEACLFATSETGLSELAYHIDIPEEATVTLSVVRDQGDQLKVEIDSNDDGIIDSTIFVQHEDTVEYLYLPLITR